MRRSLLVLAATLSLGAQVSAQVTYSPSSSVPRRSISAAPPSGAFPAPPPGLWDGWDGLAGYWKLEEGSGVNKTDSSGGAGPLTDVGGVAAVAGKHDNASSLNATTGKYLTLADASLHITNKMSISFWYNRTSGTAASNLVSKQGDYSGEGILLLENQGDGTAWLYCADSMVTATGVSAGSGTHHLVIVFDGTQATNAGKLKVWVNGAAQSLTFYGDWLPSMSLNGSDWQFATGNWVGWLDELAIWTRPLTATEVAELYASGAGKFYPF